MSILRVLVLTIAACTLPSWAIAQQQAGQAAPDAAAPDAAAPAEQEPEPVYFTRSFEFEDVNISVVAARLRSFGIPVPVLLEGAATVDITVSIPINRLTSGRAYRVEGSIESPRLRVENFRFGDLTASLLIDNGVLNLTSLEAQLLNPDDPQEVLGSVAGEATAALLPLGQLKADLQIQNLDAQFLNAFLTEPIPQLRGLVDGAVEAAVPLEDIATGAAYTATANLRSQRLTYQGVSLADATADLQFREGTATLTSLEGQLATAGDEAVRGTVRGMATAQLIPLGELSIETQFEQLDLGLIAGLAQLDQWRIAGAADVEVSATAPIDAAGQIAAWSGEGEMAIERLTLEQRTPAQQLGPEQIGPEQIGPQRTVQSARLQFEFAEATWTADPIAIDLDDVPLRGRASVRLAESADEPRGWSAELRTSEAEIADLIALAAGAAPAETTGTVSFDIEAAGRLGAVEQAADAPANDQPVDDQPAWRVAGSLAGSDIYVASFHVGPLSHQLEVTPQNLSLTPGAEADVADLLLRSLRAEYATSDQAVRLENLALEGWNGSLSGEATWSLVETGQHQAELSWADFQFDFRGDALGAEATTLRTMTSGYVEWTAPAAELDRPAAHRFELRAAVEDLRTEQLELGQLDVTVDGRTSPWQLAGSGQLLEIPTELSATLQIPAAAQWEELSRVPGRGALEAGPVALGSLMDQLSGAVGESAVQGTAGLRIELETLAAGPPRITADLRVEDLAYGDAPIADAFTAATEVGVDDGRLQLSGFRGQLTGTEPGTPPLDFAGLAVAEIAPLGNLSLEVATESMDMAWTQSWIPDGFHPVDGTARGLLQATVPLEHAGQTAAWRGVAELRSPSLVLGEVYLTSASADLVLDRAILTAERFSTVANGVAIAGSGAVELETDTRPGGTWQARLQTGGAPVKNVFALFGSPAPQPTGGYLSFDVLASGQASDPEQTPWQARGDVSGDAVEVAGFEVGTLRHQISITPERARIEPRPGVDVERLQLRRLSADYTLDDSAWQLDNLRLEGWGGMLAGNATWSQSPERPHQARFTWADLQLPIPVAGAEDEDPVVVQMRTAGSIDWAAPPDELARPSAHRFALQASARDIQTDEVALGDLRLQVEAMDPTWQVEGEGTLLGGPAEIVARVDVAEAHEWSELVAVPAAGEVAIGPMEIGRLFYLWQPDESADDWSGTASLQWTFEGDGQMPLRSSGQVAIENLVYQNETITDRLRVEVESEGRQVDIRSARGTYAGGRVQGSGRWSLGPDGARQMVIRLSSLDASRALLPVSAESADWFGGRLSADLVIAGRGPLRMTGRMELRNGETFGVESRSLRATLRGRVAMPSLRWTLQLSDVRANWGGGRLTGQLQINQSRARPSLIDLDSQFDAIDLDFQEVLAELTDGGPPTFGSGALTGTIALRGRAIQSLADLEGRIIGRLGRTDAAAVPGLLSAQNYLGVLSLRNTEFTRGAIEARLRLGELQINEFWASSDQLRVWATGSASLRSGRLDIDAVAATGDFQQGNSALVALARTFALEAATPVGWVTTANELLSNRVVNLSIGGTFERPAVRVRPAQTLTQNAARFFLQEAAGVVIPAAGVGMIGDER